MYLSICFFIFKDVFMHADIDRLEGRGREGNDHPKINLGIMTMATQRKDGQVCPRFWLRLADSDQKLFDQRNYVKRLVAYIYISLMMVIYAEWLIMMVDSAHTIYIYILVYNSYLIIEYHHYCIWL